MQHSADLPSLLPPGLHSKYQTFLAENQGPKSALHLRKRIVRDLAIRPADVLLAAFRMMRMKHEDIYFDRAHADITLQKYESDFERKMALIDAYSINAATTLAILCCAAFVTSFGVLTSFLAYEDKSYILLSISCVTSTWGGILQIPLYVQYIKGRKRKKR